MVFSLLYLFDFNGSRIFDSGDLREVKNVCTEMGAGVEAVDCVHISNIETNEGDF